MRCILTLCACSIAFVSVSCGGHKTADSAEQPTIAAPQSQAPQQPASQQPAPQARTKSGTPAPQAKAGSADMPAPPRDAQFTIVCKVDSQPGHVERIAQLKTDLIKSTPMKSWYVSHDEVKSTLFYGYYKAVDDAQLKADRIKIATMQNGIGDRPFADALPVSLNTPDPTAPPEYNLLNARGFWSLQIAAYQGQGRKEAAVDSVRAARKMGVEAYYHHGPNVSEVCIGCWPESAIRKQEYDGGGGVDVMDRDRPLLVLGAGSELPQSVKDQYSKNLVDKDSGRQVQVLEQKVEVVDPTLRKAMEDYPYHALNGEEEVTSVRDPATGQIRNIPKHSMLVQIPHNDSILGADTSPAPTLITPAAPQPPVGGKLRSVGP